MSLEPIITFLASYLVFLLITGLFILWFIDGKIKKEQVVHALFASFTAWIIAHIIKDLFPTTRPFLENGVNPLTLTTPTDSAFPSGHSAFSFALSMTIFLHDKKVGLFFIICAFLIGISRVLAHVHYPIDIAGGALLGIVVAVVVEKIHPFKLLTFSRH